MITNTQSGTNIQEVADGIFRINTPVSIPGAGQFSFNQYLIVDDAPLLFHTGQRQLFPLVCEAIRAVMPLEKLRYLGLSHFEADECGALNQFLAAAPQAVPVCSQVAAMVAIGDFADRAPHALADGAELALGRHTLKWFDTPHMPHSWECGLDDGHDHAHLFLRRPVHAGRQRRRGAYRERHPRTQRSVPHAHGLLRARADRPRPSSNGWRASSRRRWPACMAARGAGMGRSCCASSAYRWRRRGTRLAA